MAVSSTLVAIFVASTLVILAIASAVTLYLYEFIVGIFPSGSLSG